MNIQLIPGGVLPVLGAILIAALGVAVLLFRPIRPVQRAFFVYAVSFGLCTGLSRLHFPADPAAGVVVWSIVALGIPVASIALIRVAWLQAGPLPARTRWMVGAPALGLLTGAWGLLFVGRHEAAVALGAYGTDWSVAHSLGWAALVGFTVASFFAAGMLALGARRGVDEEAARQRALVSTAILIFPSFHVTGFLFYPGLFGQTAGFASLAGSILVAALWISQGERSLSPRAHRNAALAPLAAVVAGMLFALAGRSDVAGLARVATVGVLVYAILRHHVLDMDVKVRWTVSKSALAGIFVAVFFAASELTQHFFGRQFRSELMGIAAAALLVLGITPLQRLADRFAAKAVPPPGPLARQSTREARRLYASLAHRLAQDELSLEDERFLAYIAQEMGLTPVDVHEAMRGIRHQGRRRGPAAAAQASRHQAARSASPRKLPRRGERAATGSLATREHRGAGPES